MTTKKQINLIPSELTVTPSAVKLTRILNKISTIGVIMLIFAVLVLISTLVYFDFKYKAITADVDSLKSKILVLEKSEQKLVLAKDRISKIMTIQKIDSVDTEIENFRDFQNIIPSVASGSALTEVNIDPIKTVASMKFENSDTLRTTLSSISKLSKYKKVVLSSLGYSTNGGFIVDLLFND